MAKVIAKSNFESSSKDTFVQLNKVDLSYSCFNFGMFNFKACQQLRNEVRCDYRKYAN